MKLFLGLMLSFLLTVVLCSCSPVITGSRVFPAFGKPVVQENYIFSYYTWGKVLLCLDMESSTVLWRAKLRHPIFAIWATEDDHLVARQRSSIVILDSLTGKILCSKTVPGYVFGLTPDETAYCLTDDDDIVCVRLDDGNQHWRYKTNARGSNVWPSHFQGFVFALVRPRSITTTYTEGQAQTTSIEGSNRLICLSARNGAELWKEGLPLSQAGSEPRIHICAASEYILCATDNRIRLLDRQTGEVMRVLDSPEDIDGAAFWNEHHIVLCLGGIGKTTKTVRVLGANDFAVQSEFPVEAKAVSSAKVVANVLILGSLYQHVGVDLLSGKMIWKVGQLWGTVRQDNLIFGGHTGDGWNAQRVLGALDPKTGEMRLLHSE